MIWTSLAVIDSLPLRRDASELCSNAAAYRHTSALCQFVEMEAWWQFNAAFESDIHRVSDNRRSSSIAQRRMIALDAHRLLAPARASTDLGAFFVFRAGKPSPPVKDTQRLRIHLSIC
jgi:hypothetical protein